MRPRPAQPSRVPIEFSIGSPRRCKRLHTLDEPAESVNPAAARIGRPGDRRRLPSLQLLAGGRSRVARGRARDHNGPPMEALLRKVSVGVLVSRLGTLALIIAITVVVNEPEDWQPTELVVALA